MKAILLHHAGGDKYAFRPLQEHLLPELQSMAIELPGRGDRFSEPLLETIDEMLEDLMAQLEEEIAEPYILVGMSMGAVLAFLLTHQLRKGGYRLPEQLVLASRLPFQHYETREGLERLPSAEFWKFIGGYDERSTRIAEHEELRELFEPIMRADFKAMQGFDERFKDLAPLPVKASVLYGDEDHRMFDAEKAKQWSLYFEKIPAYVCFRGGHFFLYENPDVAAYLQKIALPG